MFRLSKKIDFGDYKFIIPCVSVGNVGQLTCDLIIASYNLTKIGTVWHKAIIPAYGSNPFDNNSKDNCVACELYACEEQKIAVLQLRSSIEARMRRLFLNDLKSYIIDEKFAQVIILTSSFAYEMHDVSSAQFRYVSNSNLEEVFQSNNIQPLERVHNQLTIYGSGFATDLYELLANDTKVAIIVKYASEGDNRPDAISMFRIAQLCLGVKDVKIMFPDSWALVYGSPPPIGIY